MKFTVVTPSFNQLGYLKRCIASVRDQITPEAQRSEDGCQRSDSPISDLRPPIAELQVHHHIQDGGSTDGTSEWLAEYQSKVQRRRSKEIDPESRTSSPASAYTFSYASEPDSGMYDALNKGVELVLNSVGRDPLTVNGEDISDNSSQITDNRDGSIVAWLNCDEQYLPGTLQNVSRYFSGHPEVDIACGDALLISPDGDLITYRKNPPLRRAYVLADHLYTQSAAMFFRAGIFASGIRFDPLWKAVGDCDFISRVLFAGYHPGQIKAYLAACTMTGANLSCAQAGVAELQKFRRSVPVLYRIGRRGLNLLRYAEKMLRGGYRQQVPFEYEVYGDPALVREKITAAQADFRFKWGPDEKVS